MDQYRICRLRPGRLGAGPPFVVVLQRDQIQDIRTRVVAPLMPFGQVMPATKLHPRITIEGIDYVVMMERLAATDVTILIESPYDASSIRDDLTRAIDILFTG